MFPCYSLLKQHKYERQGYRLMVKPDWWFDGHLEIINVALIEDILCILKFNPLQNQQMVNLDVTDVHQHLTHWQNLRPIVTVTRSIWNHSNVNSVKEDSIYSTDWKNMRNGIYPCKISADQGSADGLRIQKRNYMRNPSIKGHLFANIVTKPLNAIQRWSLIFACTPANDPFLAMSVERAMYPTRLWASIGRCTKISYKEIIVHKFLQNIIDNK